MVISRYLIKELKRYFIKFHIQLNTPKQSHHQ